MSFDLQTLCMKSAVTSSHHPSFMHLSYLVIFLFFNLDILSPLFGTLKESVQVSNHSFSGNKFVSCFFLTMAVGVTVLDWSAHHFGSFIHSVIHSKILLPSKIYVFYLKISFSIVYIAVIFLQINMAPRVKIHFKFRYFHQRQLCMYFVWRSN